MAIEFTELRLDTNNTLDSKMRSSRYKNTQSGEYPHCNITQNIEHIFLNCRHPDMVKYIQYVTSFKDKHQAGKIKEIINVNPSCPSNIK